MISFLPTCSTVSVEKKKKERREEQKNLPLRNNNVPILGGGKVGQWKYVPTHK